ncbi:hypothetical protein Tco_1146087 [Tanacetum coccineum]
MYYQVFRGDGSSKNYKILSEMLEDFDRMDVEQLFRLVKERYSSTAPEGYDLMLWGDLHTFVCEPIKDDEIWRDQHEYNLLSWRLCDFCGIHILLMDNGLAIHKYDKKKNPLESRRCCSKMLIKGGGLFGASATILHSAGIMVLPRMRPMIPLYDDGDLTTMKFIEALAECSPSPKDTISDICSNGQDI